MAATRPRYRSLIGDSARWEGFRFRPGDIVISTPAKCGTTWTQMICALLVFQRADLPAALDRISPWLDMLTRDRDDVIAELDAQTHRRIIKTHTPLDGLAFEPEVTYITVGRDPRDVARSWDNHVANMDFVSLLGARAEAVGLDDLAELMPDGPPVVLGSEIDRFWAWVDDDTPVITSGSTLAQTVHHLTTFWSVRDEPNIVMLHYDELRADLDGQMRLLGDRLDIEVAADRWPELVDAATFERMRDSADRVAPDTTHKIWQSNQQFFHRGTSGQWRELLDDRDLARYRARVAALAEPGLARWIHGYAVDRDAFAPS